MLLLEYLPDSPYVAGEKKESTGNGNSLFRVILREKNMI